MPREDGIQTAAQPLSPAELDLIHAWWRAANYLSVGQIYLLDNPLLERPLERADIKPRLLGHWGTTPGLNFVYVHLNRVIKARGLDVIYICGPGHGGPGMVANTWLEGTYSEIYPNIPQNKDGMQRLFKQFSFPGGIPSHAAPETPGSINEGGELGYSLSHAYGAALDNPNLIVACVVGDGEAETGPLATSWHGNKFLNPATAGAVLPILHLNGYKIANPTILARIPREALENLFIGYGYKPHFVGPRLRCVDGTNRGAGRRTQHRRVAGARVGRPDRRGKRLAKPGLGVARRARLGSEPDPDRLGSRLPVHRRNPHRAGSGHRARWGAQRGTRGAPGSDESAGAGFRADRPRRRPARDPQPCRSASAGHADRRRRHREDPSCFGRRAPAAFAVC
jgi:hypothetical protein